MEVGWDCLFFENARGLGGGLGGEGGDVIPRELELVPEKLNKNWYLVSSDFIGDVKFIFCR